MNEWLREWMNDNLENECMNDFEKGWKKKRMIAWINESTIKTMKEWINDLENEWINESMNEWNTERTDEWINECKIDLENE